MIEQIRQQYDSLYSSTDEFSFGAGRPVPVVLRLPEYVAEGTVLDIGGGDGRHALALAKLGYEVTVSDVSVVGLEKLQSKAQQQKLTVYTQVADVLTDEIVGTYNAMVCTFVCHHLPAAAVPDLIARMQQHTSLQGVHIFATFLNKGGLYERNNKSESGRYYPSLEALRTAYDGWEILECFSRETTSLAKDKTGNHLLNDIGVLVAKKNDSHTTL